MVEEKSWVSRRREGRIKLVGLLGQKQKWLPDQNKRLTSSNRRKLGDDKTGEENKQNPMAVTKEDAEDFI